MKSDYQFLVIGGGPAGSTVASLLAEYGLSVCLIERKVFPREVLCGEFLSAEVSSYLKQSDLFKSFKQLNPVPINSFRLFNSDGAKLFSKLNFEAYALKRSLFDKLLLDDAVKKGTHLIMPGEVKSVINDGSRYLITVHTKNDNKEITAEQVIGAYGKQNILDKALGRSFIQKTTGYSGIKFHLTKSYFHNPPAGEIQIYLSDGIYCGINQVNDNDFTICYLANVKQSGLNPKDGFVLLLKDNKFFAGIFNEGINNIINESKIYGTANIFFGSREKHLNGIYFAGDSAGVIAPFAGDGIAMAIQSAVLLAQHFKNYPHISDKQEYVNNWNKLFRTRLFTAKAIQNIILNKYLSNSVVKAAGMIPGFLPLLISKTRAV